MNVHRSINSQRWTKAKIKETIEKIKNKQLNEDWTFSGDKLYYYEQQVIAREDVHNLLLNLYNDPKFIGGRDSIYGKIKNEYWGISQQDIQTFLNNQEVVQLRKPIINQKEYKSITVSKPFIRFQVDLVDMSQWSGYNKGKKWILTCIDVFTKFLWVKPMANKNANTVINAMTEILDSIKPNKPHIIQSDNGSEFISTVWKDELNKRNIKIVYSSPYYPQTQGIIERTNGTLKSMIKTYWIRNNTNNWIDVIDALVANYNQTVHSTTGFAPRYAGFNNNVSEVKANIEKKAIMRNSHARTLPELKVGDYVRISAYTDSTIRKEAKSYSGKAPVENWSRDIYQITKLVKRTDEWHPQMYRIANDNRTFKREDLLQVDIEHLIKTSPLNVQASTSAQPRVNKGLSKRRQKEQEELEQQLQTMLQNKK